MPNKTPCAVLGGSFNPPTRAHRIIIQSAMQALHAENGIYVPSSNFYVMRKVQRNPYAEILSEQERLKMLQTPAMSLNGKVLTDTCEFGDQSKGRTLKTLDELQAKYPEFELYFIIGCDKIPVFHRWPTAETILQRHNLLWMGRGEIDFKQVAETSPLLSKYMDKIQFMPSPEETETISSSHFWQLKSKRHPKANEMLEPVVADLINDIFPD